MKTKISGPSVFGFINSLVGIKLVFLMVFVVAVIMLIQTIKGDEEPLRIGNRDQAGQSSGSIPDDVSGEHRSGEKED